MMTNSLSRRTVYRLTRDSYVVVDRFESSLYSDWIAGVSEACSFNLAQQLLVRNEQTKLISVNFDPQVWFHVTFVHRVYALCA